MADLIDRAALIASIDELHEHCGHCDGYGYISKDKAMQKVKAAPAVDAVPVVKRTEEVEKSICVLNVYRNTYYKEPSGTVKYAVADAINTILPLFAKCLERRTDATD